MLVVVVIVLASENEKERASGIRRSLRIASSWLIRMSRQCSISVELDYCDKALYRDVSGFFFKKIDDELIRACS